MKQSKHEKYLNKVNRNLEIILNRRNSTMAITKARIILILLMKNHHLLNPAFTDHNKYPNVM